MSRRSARKAWFGEDWAAFPQLVGPIAVPEPVRELLRKERHSEAWVELERMAEPLRWDGLQLLWSASDDGVAEATLELAFEYASSYQPQYAYRLATYALKEATHPGTLAMAQQMRLAWLWEWTGDLDAIRSLMQTTAPLTPSALAVVARYMSDGGRHDEAISILQDLVSQGFVDISLRLGNTLEQAGRIDEAEEAFRVGAEGEKGDTRCAFNAGNMLYEVGRTDEADNWFRRAASQGERRALRRLRSNHRHRKRLRRRVA